MKNWKSGIRKREEENKQKHIFLKLLHDAHQPSCSHEKNDSLREKIIELRKIILKNQFKQHNL